MEKEVGPTIQKEMDEYVRKRVGPGVKVSLAVSFTLYCYVMCILNMHLHVHVYLTYITRELELKI